MKLKADPLALKIGLGLFVIALLIRLMGIDWGLPNATRHHSLHPDEEIVWMYSQQVEPAKGKFTPGFYNYGTFYLTLNRVAGDIVQAYGGGVKQQDGSDFPEALGRMIRAGRNLSALAGAGLAWVVFLLLYRRTHLFGAIAGGAVIVVAPALVIHSRFMTVDMVATFFLAVSLYWASKLVPFEGEEAGPVVRYAVWSGVFAGLSAGTKYTGILALIVPVLLCLWLMKSGKGASAQAGKALGAAVLAGCVVFLVTTPGMLLESDKFWTDFRYEMTHTSTGHGLVFAGTAPGWILQFSHLMTGFGIFATLLGLAGLVVAYRKSSEDKAGGTKVILAAAFLLVVIYFLIGRAEVKFLRYTFPMMPIVAMGFGWLVGESHASKSKGGRIVAALGILSIGGLGGGMVGVLTTTGWMTGQDPQAEMAQRIRELEIDTVGLASDPWYYTPTLYPEANAGPFRGPAYRFEAMFEAASPRVVRYLPENPAERFDFDLRLLTELQPDAVVFSSFEMEGVDRLSKLDSVPEAYRLQTERYREFIEVLQQDYELVAVSGAGGVGPDGNPTMNPYQRIHDLMYIRPLIYLWKRKTDSPTTSTGSSIISEPSEEPVLTP